MNLEFEVMLNLSNSTSEVFLRKYLSKPLKSAIFAKLQLKKI